MLVIIYIYIYSTFKTKKKNYNYISQDCGSEYNTSVSVFLII